MRIAGKKGGWIRRTLLLCLLSGSFSCAAPRGTPEGNFKAVAPHLETGGPVYAIGYLPDLVQMGKKAVAERRERFWRSPITRETRRKQERILSLMELFWELSGCDAFTGWGYSSTAALPEGMFRNRFFLSSDPSAVPGIVQNLFWEENQPYPFRPEELPQGCFFAAALHLRPEAAWNTLKRSGKSGEKLLLFLAETNLPLTELIHATQGWWTLMLAETGGNIGFRIEIPDLDGTASRIFRTHALCVPGAREEKPGRLILKEKNKSFLFLFEPGKILLFSSLDMESFFTDPAVPKGKDNPEAAPFFSEVPDEGIAFLFSRKKMPLSRCFPLFFPPESPFSEWEVDDFCGALTRDKEGYLWSEKGSSHWNRILFSGMLKAADMLLDFLPVGHAAEEEELFLLGGPDSASHEVTEEGEEKIQTLGRALFALRKADGSFPEKGSIALFQELLNEKRIRRQILAVSGRAVLPEKRALSWEHCSYCYFPWNGKGFQGKKCPLLMTRPQTYPDYFYVFFTDGTVQKFMLSRPDTCRRLISHLYTVCHWEEEDFRLLIEQAEQLDRELKGE